MTVSNIEPIILDHALTKINEDGQTKIKITHVALGDKAWQPTPDSQGLVNEIFRVPVKNIKNMGDGVTHIDFHIDGKKQFVVREMAFILDGTDEQDSGTVFAIHSTPDQEIAHKTANSTLLMALDMQISQASAKVEPIELTGLLSLNDANQFNKGVVRLADIDQYFDHTINDPAAVLPMSIVRQINAQNNPVGQLVAMFNYTVPPGCLFCDGRWCKRTEFPELFDYLGHVYSSSLNPTQRQIYFCVPDMRNAVPRGFEPISAQRRGEAMGVRQFSQVGTHKHDRETTTKTKYSSGGNYLYNIYYKGAIERWPAHSKNDENRMENQAVSMWIRYRS